MWIYQNAFSTRVARCMVAGIYKMSDFTRSILFNTRSSQAVQTCSCVSQLYGVIKLRGICYCHKYRSLAIANINAHLFTYFIESESSCAVQI